jgi:Domain of unknown function (DUF4907)
VIHSTTIKKGLLAFCLLALAIFSFLKCDSVPSAQTSAPAQVTKVPTPPNPAATTFPQEKATQNLAAAKSPKALTATITPQTDGTWGYDILGDGKLLIHQPHIPALSGNSGFATAAQAERVAALAIQKMKKGESLPTLSVSEVQALIAQ